MLKLSCSFLYVIYSVQCLFEWYDGFSCVWPVYSNTVYSNTVYYNTVYYNTSATSHINSKRSDGFWYDFRWKMKKSKIFWEINGTTSAFISFHQTDLKTFLLKSTYILNIIYISKSIVEGAQLFASHPSTVQRERSPRSRENLPSPCGLQEHPSAGVPTCWQKVSNQAHPRFERGRHARVLEAFVQERGTYYWCYVSCQAVLQRGGK